MLANVQRATKCGHIGNQKDYLHYRKGSGDTIEIYDIAVRTERGKGTGRNMFKSLLKVTKPERVFAITRKSNHIAQKFYEALGFKGYDLPEFYPDESAMIYIWVKQ